MRILHTADWHLGHKLYDQDRTREHAATLDWLLDLIRDEKIDVVIIAGDVFDVSNPSNQAKSLYYGFLAGLIQLGVHAAVVVGGNHDSPSMLDAPAEILGALNLHVIGSARPRVQDQVVKIRVPDGVGAAELIVAAVPFLRERDVRTARYGESADDRMAALRAGIADHFISIGRAATEARSGGHVPIVATGHLFVSGASDAEDKQSHIYQADENNIEAGLFPDCFDYVALGHVHRAQSVAGLDHVRYSGSLVPLTFLEGRHERSVRIVDISGAGRGVTSRKVKVPYARTLLRLHGTLKEVKTKLTAAAAELSDAPPGTLTAWAEVRVKSDEQLVNLRETLLDYLREASGVEDPSGLIRFIRTSRVHLNPAPASAQHESRDLDDLEPTDVLDIVCTTHELSDGARKDAYRDFRELINWIEDQDAQAAA